MDASRFLGLEPTAATAEFRLPVTPGICSSIPALFGGCGLAAGIAAMELATGRPAIWATAQFLDFAHPDTVIDVRVDEVVRGHNLSQARCSLSVDGREIIHVLGALGRRDLELGGSWAVMPSMPAPDLCQPRPVRADQVGTVAARIDVRLANARAHEDLNGEPGDGRSALWLRVPELEPGVAVLAILGDFVPSGIAQALGRRYGGNSIDNTLRIVDAEAAGGWILADVRVHAVRHGFGHGLVHLWSEDGRLLATAGQSAIVRPWDRRPPTRAED